MRRTARHVLAALSVAALLGLVAAAPVSVRANGFAQQADTWVATSGTPTGSTAGSSCANPGFVVDGVEDEIEIGYAITDVLDGGTVHLCAGVYHVTTGQSYSKSFTLAGAGRDATVIVGTATFGPSGAYVSGGSEFLYGSGTLNVRDLTIRGFYGSSYGALYGGDEFILDRVRMDHNGNTDGDGGAIWGGDVTVRDSKLHDNFASEDGGAIDASDLTVERSTFLRNKANVNGGAFTGTGVVTIKKSDFIENYALNQGGAGFTYSSSTVTITGSRFRKNSTFDSHGGALRLYESESLITYTSFTANHTGSSGGAIDAFGGTLKLISSRFYDNKADGNGGAFVSWEQNSLVALRNLFLRNVAFADGGAILEHASGVPPRIQFNIFERNRSLNNPSGAIAADAGDVYGGAGPNLLGITHNTFKFNSSSLGSTILIYQCEAPSAASVRAITKGNVILRKKVDATGPRVRFWTVGCTPPG